MTEDADSERVVEEAARRRTFAIISHPDAGKTTLTEKLLLYAGAVAEAGSVTARRGRRAATSDWMELERRRGISVTSTVLRFEHEQIVFNLLDTPGHKDFSEDTLRVLAAVDSAVILIDAARGVEPQTEQLFQVARARGIPLIAFVNKYDRPGMEPLEMVDHLTESLGLPLAPLTWPVGIPGAFRGVIDRRDDTFHRFTRVTGGSAMALEQIVQARGRDVASEDDGRVGGRRGGARARRRGRQPRSTPRRSRAAPASRCCSARPRGTSASGCCWTRCASSPPRPARARWRTARRDRSTRRSRRSCSRCRPTWTRATATGWRSCASARGGSSAGCGSTTRAPAAAWR